MTQPPIDPARVPDATARQLLARAAELDADGPTLAQLRQAASEAGISGGAFDAAVVEWRTKHTLAAPQTTRRAWLDAIGRNAVACAGSWISLSAFAAVQRLIQAPWLLHKLSDPVGLAIGAAIAVRLRARTAAVILGGLAVSQGAEFLMDVSGGAPAVQGAARIEDLLLKFFLLGAEVLTRGVGNFLAEKLGLLFDSLQLVREAMAELVLCSGDFLFDGSGGGSEDVSGLFARLLQSLRTEILAETRPELLLELRRNLVERNFKAILARSAGQFVAQLEHFFVERLHELSEQALEMFIRELLFDLFKRGLQGGWNLSAGGTRRRMT